MFSHIVDLCNIYLKTKIEKSIYFLYNPMSLQNVYNGCVDVIDNSEITDTIMTSLATTSEVLTTVWRLFRTTDFDCLTKYGFPVDNRGIPVEIPIIPLEHKQVFAIVRDWFVAFISSDDDVLHIETPLGGIFIRKTKPNESHHKFVTADLPPNDYGVVTFERIVNNTAR